ncbi:dethiobiotin synthase [Pedobacter sp. HMF7647]|uniref:ATP-dependent dethiobiotin synthetase BioD n=1 Tax=Hufsiella arboris TaxID=2695275 RepID=A0A7K1Y7T6_9SPHI|nr:dethiobiotin synthase [Hufsiella arboris]MXV50643.1 dethiobiotin synthase [Hufsiella arboris]
MKPLFISGIGTGVGKTVVSAVLVEKLKADYWKPVQSGDLENSDTLTVKSLVTNDKSNFFQEAFRLTQPFSPHKSAALDNIEIKLNDFILPETKNHLVIEGAGGLMVPLNNQDLIIDLIQKLNATVILVVRHYLGSINHTMLSIEALKNRKIDIAGLVFNGNSDEFSESVILEQSLLPVVGRLPDLPSVTKGEIAKLANFIEI